MLDNDDFIAWSNETIVAVVGHNGAVGGKEDHKPATEKDPKTKEEREVCPVYPGLTCKEHQDLRAAFSNPPDGGVKPGLDPVDPNLWDCARSPWSPWPLRWGGWRSAPS